QFHVAGGVEHAHPVTVGAAGVVSIGKHHAAAGGAGRDDEVFGHFGRAGVTGFLKPERVPAFVVLVEQLGEFFAQAGQASASGFDTGFELGLGIAGVGVALVAVGLGGADGLGGGFAGGGGAGDAVDVGHFAGRVGGVEGAQLLELDHRVVGHRQRIVGESDRIPLAVPLLAERGFE